MEKEQQQEKLRRLKWACRRGMLELDVLLSPFVEKHFDGLTAEQQLAFEELLAQDDPELFAWFMGHQSCPDPDLAQMVSLILERNTV